MVMRLEHTTCKQKLRAGFVQSGKQKSKRGINICPSLPRGKGNLRRQRQILLRDAQQKDKKQQSQDTARDSPMKHTENVLKQRMVKHWSVAQRGCRISILEDFQVLLG